MGNDYEYEYTRILQNLTSNIALRMQNAEYEREKDRKKETKRQREKGPLAFGDSKNTSTSTTYE